MIEKIISIDRLAFGGEGVGRDEGKVVFVPWTAPGDKVRAQIVSDHGRFERGEIVEILEKSPDRIDPLCPVFGRCGGCQWQHLGYETQLKAKEEILRETLERVGQVRVAILPIIPSPQPWHYRQRIQLKVDPEGRIGFYRSRSHEVVTFEECKIADPRLNERLAEMKKESEPRPEGDFELSLAGNNGDVFSQVNPEQNKKLVQLVLDNSFGNAESAFTRKKILVELYAGSGNFTFPLAGRVGQVIAVESSSEAVRQGQEKMVASGIENIEWIEGHVEWGLKKIYRKKISPDILVLDPPRRGAKEILDLISLIRPRLLVYVSCDPVTLSRDLRELLRRHYRLERIQPIDMFPQTYHVESVVRLERKEE